MRMKVGTFSERVINAIGLDIKPGTPIYIADSNIEHMKSRHPDDYEKYGAYIEHIISHPDYVGKNKKDDSVEFTKEFLVDQEYVKVAVRISTSGTYYTRSMYELNPSRVKNFIKKGTLIKLDN